MRTRSVRPSLVVLACWLSAAAATTSVVNAAPAGPPVVVDLPLPGGVAGLLTAANLPGSADPAIAMLSVVRATYANRTVRLEALVRYLDGTTASQAADLIPLPLPPETWASAVLRRTVPRAQLARAIFGDRRAAMLYYGLMALDDDTLRYFADHPALVSAIAAQNAGTFAEWGRSIRVRNGRMQLPGAQTTAAWADLVGQSPADPVRFIRALLSRDGGRVAFFYDTVMHLDPARQAFALGGAATGRDGFRSLYDVFGRTATLDSSGDWPVVRHPAGPAGILAQVRVSETGRMAAPSSRALWDAAFAGNLQACAHMTASGDEADAAWLVERVEREVLEKRAQWIAAITFVQRVFGRAEAVATPAVCELAARFPRQQALLLTLERIGLDDPGDYLKAARFADRLWSGVDRTAAVVRTAQAQGVLVVLERAVAVRVIDGATARRVAMSLAGLPAAAKPSPADSGPAPGAVAEWTRTTLLPALCTAQTDADACLVRAVSGRGEARRTADGAMRDVEWEGEHYRVDLGAATAARLERVRRVQKATRIGDALQLVALAARVPDAPAEDVQREASTALSLRRSVTVDLAEIFGHPVPGVRDALQAAGAKLTAKPGTSERAEIASALAGAGDVLLADALCSFAYAVSIGEPDDAALMGGDPSRQHRFDSTVGPGTGPWQLPEDVQVADRMWLVEGSILGLRTVFAESWLRRLSIEDPGMAPRPDRRDVRGFGETAATFNGFDLTDAGRDRIVAAIGRGRARFAALLSSPDELWAEAREMGMSEWRCRAAQWTVGREKQNSTDYIALSELMWLGKPDVTQAQLDGWGTAARALDGSLGLRMPCARPWEDFQGPRGVGLLATWVADIHLHVAEMLAERNLPASLAPEIAAYVAWDVISTARMGHPDDWLALIQATRQLPADQTFDYIAALTAIGPLVPAR